MDLEVLKRRLDEEENRRFGVTRTDGVRGPVVLKYATDADGKISPQEELSLDEVEAWAGSQRELTTVYFIVGEAGMGKTSLMLEHALKRAHQVELGKDSNAEPLYLFVTSTGRTLASLEDAVNSTLRNTKILNTDSAKALCRNGLLVLMVDGFDELLGSSGYQNALGSLGPWFDSLSGRGIIVASARSSYYLTQYRKSLKLVANKPYADHHLVELQRWEKRDAENYLVGRKIPKSVLSALDKNVWSLLCVPFFANAFASVYRRGSYKNSDEFAVLEIVVDQFLTREASKLADVRQHRPLLSATELRSLFSEVAEIMQVSRTRVVEYGDLLLCLRSVLGVEDVDAERPGLTHRLTAICSIESAAGGSDVFVFSHLIMFDCFLYLSLLLKLENGHYEAARSMFTSAALQRLVLSLLAEKCRDKVVRLLEYFNSSSPSTAIFAENLGEMWRCALDASQGSPPTMVVRELVLTQIRLVGSSSVTFVGCRIVSLDLLEFSGTVTFREAVVQALKCKDESAFRSILRGNLTEDFIKSIHFVANNDYVMGVKEVRGRLMAMGVITDDGDLEGGECMYIVRYYLEKIDLHPEVPVMVLSESYKTDSNGLRWTSRYGEGYWTSFVGMVYRCGLAKLEPRTVGGLSKSRLYFLVPVKSILEQGKGDVAVERFWDEVKNMR